MSSHHAKSYHVHYTEVPGDVKLFLRFCQCANRLEGFFSALSIFDDFLHGFFVVLHQFDQSELDMASI